MISEEWRRLEINGGRVEAAGGRPSVGDSWCLHLPPVAAGYADAQIDDYGRCGSRQRYPWRPGVRLRVQARFSHDADSLLGTAGFGFWNAPFGDPTVRWPALPQAAWFFFGSAPTDLPLAASGPGRGWFAATVDARRGQALALAPLAPLVLLLNQIGPVRRRLWPWVQRQLGMALAPVPAAMTVWHDYCLEWRAGTCRFLVDGRLLLVTPFSPHGPLGFVCWLDNQYMVLSPNGRVDWGVLPVSESQWLEISWLDLEIIDV
jgi:hypothetical protein